MRRRRSPSGLFRASNGDFYGTTGGGGVHNWGTIFKITPDGTFTTLYSFCSQSGCTDGAYPLAGLIQASNGDLYGTTAYGGANNTCNTGSTAPGCGTIYKITPGSTLATVYSFCALTNCTDGQVPMAGLVQDTNGTLYGTTGGSLGTVFRLSVGLGPFVETQTTSGKVGAHVKILGNNLAHASKVTFNGTAASFTASAQNIQTTVPAGATTGTVQVVTPSATLSSNMSFQVK